MSLLRKTLLVVASVVIVSTISLYFASQLTLLQGYEKIEQDDTRANVLRTVNSFYDQAKGLNLVARGYAFWDEATARGWQKSCKTCSITPPNSWGINHSRTLPSGRREPIGMAALILFVADNGMRIAPAYHQRIFGLFDKLDPRSEGTGIGLALVKRIVEVHGGHIWIESDGNGQGATFYFTLPPGKGR
jgi:Histidine kinase-, DNA gyrase B-, and HSP90-like ATPase